MSLTKTTLVWASMVAAACSPSQDTPPDIPDGAASVSVRQNPIPNSSKGSPPPDSALGSSDPWKQRLLAEVDEAEQRWRALNIRDYHLVVEAGSAWGMSSLEMTFRNNRLVTGWANVEGLPPFGPRSSGRSRRFELDVTEGDRVTVHSLFQEVRSGIRHSTNPNHFKVRFHPTYGYPQKTTYDDPDWVDEESWLEVKAFRVIPASG